MELQIDPKLLVLVPAVIGLAARIRKLYPAIDGWKAIGIVVACSVVVLLAFSPGPTILLFCRRVLVLSLSAIGTVFTADRVKMLQPEASGGGDPSSGKTSTKVSPPFDPPRKT